MNFQLLYNLHFIIQNCMCLYFIKFLTEMLVWPARPALLACNLGQLNRSKFKELNNFMKCFSGLPRLNKPLKALLFQLNTSKSFHTSLWYVPIVHTMQRLIKTWLWNINITNFSQRGLVVPYAIETRPWNKIIISLSLTTWSCRTICD